MKKIYTFIILMILGTAALHAQDSNAVVMRDECDMPSNLIVRNIPDGISLRWTGVPDAQAYNIYRDGDYLATVSSEDNGYLDEGVVYLQEYCYRVSTQCSEELESAPCPSECSFYCTNSLTFNVDTLWITDSSAPLLIYNLTNEAFITLERITAFDNSLFYFDYNETVFHTNDPLGIDIQQGEKIAINVNLNSNNKEQRFALLQFVNSFQNVSLVVGFNWIADVHESSVSEIRVFPNPANDFVTIQGENLGTIRILNTLGQTIDEITTDKDEATLSTSNLKEGVYFIKTSNGGVQRFVKR